MNRSKKRIVGGAAAAAAAILTVGIQYASAQTADAQATQPTVQELEQQIANLQSKVDALSNAQQKTEDEKAEEIKTILADADRQSVLTSGWDPNTGFVLRSGDGAFSFHPGVLIDVRNMTSYRARISTKLEGETGKFGYDTENGFDITRARLTFDGNMTKDITYFVQFSADQGASAGLLDAYWVYHLGADNPFSVKVGQFKDPLWHERNISEINLMAVDRSLVESLLGGGQTSRVQGVSFMYDKDRFRGQLVIDDGYDSLNTKFFDAGGMAAGVTGGAGVTPTDFGTAGRFEYLVLGQRTATLHPFSQYDNGFTALGAQQDFLIAGAGYDYSQAGDNSILFHTADLQYDTQSGFSAYAAYLGTYRDLHASQGVTAGKPAVPPGNFYDPGAEAQLAYLITPRIEPFVRYDYTYLSDDSVGEFGLKNDVAQEITAGVNYYIFKQRAKITVDGTYLPNGSPVDSDALGILEDSGQKEYVLRVQFQLSI